MDWSLASNESTLSLHMGNATISREHGIIGLAAALKLDETRKSNELVNPVLSLPSVKSDDERKGEEHTILIASGKEDVDDGKKIKSEVATEPENQITKETPVISLIPVNESQDAEISDSDSDNEDVGSIIEEMIKFNCKEQDMSNVTSKQEDNEDDGDDVMEITQDDSSICSRSETSNTSISSFTFPILHNEDGSVKTLSLETMWNVCDKRLEWSQPQTQPQPQFYFIPATHTLTQLKPQRKSSLSKSSSETQSQKAFRNRWFSCFYHPFNVIDSRYWRRKEKKN